jgi:hypothetical protein
MPLSPDSSRVPSCAIVPVETSQPAHDTLGRPRGRRDVSAGARSYRGQGRTGAGCVLPSRRFGYRNGKPFEETPRRPRDAGRVSWTGCGVSTGTLPRVAWTDFPSIPAATDRALVQRAERASALRAGGRGERDRAVESYSGLRSCGLRLESQIRRIQIQSSSIRKMMDRLRLTSRPPLQLCQNLGILDPVALCQIPLGIVDSTLDFETLGRGLEVFAQ